MENKFTDHNEFDKYIQEQDKWIYDNGWSYQGEHFSAYMLESFDKIASGKLVEYLVMLRDEENSNKTIVLHGKDTKLDEMWSGHVNSQDEYQAMMTIINWQNLQNSYPRRKRTGYYGILPLRVQVLQKHRTHAASCGVFCENKFIEEYKNNLGAI